LKGTGWAIHTANQNSCKQNYFVAASLTGLWCIRLPFLSSPSGLAPRSSRSCNRAMNLPRPPRAVIFDMDGLMIDTVPAYGAAMVAASADASAHIRAPRGHYARRSVQPAHGPSRWGAHGRQQQFVGAELCKVGKGADAPCPPLPA